MKQIAGVFSIWIALMAAAQAASFDCAKAGTKIEHIICDNPEISKLDEELNAVYKAALQNVKQADSIKQTQKQWLKERNVCVDTVCVKRAYEARLQSLGWGERGAGFGNAGLSVSSQTVNTDNNSEDQEFPQKPPKLRYSICDKIKPGLECEGQTGKGYSVCEDYLKHLQALTSPPTCEAPIPQGFRQPDWEEMDVTQHLDLAYQAEGYFLKRFGGYKHPNFDTWRQTFLQEIKDKKINPRMRKAKVVPNDKGVATILAYTRDKDACHISYGLEEQLDTKSSRRLGMPPNPYRSSQGNAGQLWTGQGNVHFLLPEDTPHTLQAIVGDVSRSLTDLLLYSGKPYFVEIIREYTPLYKSRDEQARARNGLVNGKSITWMDNSSILVFAFDQRFPDIRPNLDLNHYLADRRCQFLPY